MSDRGDAPLASIGPLRPAERCGAVDVLARAFRDNPLNVAVIRSEDAARRVRSNYHGTRTLLPVAEVYGEVRVAGNGGTVLGALMATPPHAYPLPPPPLPSRLHCLLAQGWRVARRWGEVFEALDALHPVEPHWYLGALGVDPGVHGRGIGSALLRGWLEDVDRDARPAYLETDRVENVGFYRRVGFEVVDETAIFGAWVWCMRRSAAG
jgi:ribosomal protein S18 acetylase RimI-like enzyme